MNEVEVMNSKRMIIFKDGKSETQGFKILHMARMPFSYRDNGKYVITKKQCAILKAQNIEYKIKKYL